LKWKTDIFGFIYRVVFAKKKKLNKYLSNWNRMWTYYIIFYSIKYNLNETLKTSGEKIYVFFIRRMKTSMVTNLNSFVLNKTAVYREELQIYYMPSSLRVTKNYRIIIIFNFFFVFSFNRFRLKTEREKKHNIYLHEYPVLRFSCHCPDFIIRLYIYMENRFIGQRLIGSFWFRYGNQQGREQTTKSTTLFRVKKIIIITIAVGLSVIIIFISYN